MSYRLTDLVYITFTKVPTSTFSPEQCSYVSFLSSLVLMLSYNGFWLMAVLVILYCFELFWIMYLCEFAHLLNCFSVYAFKIIMEKFAQAKVQRKKVLHTDIRHIRKMLSCVLILSFLCYFGMSYLGQIEGIELNLVCTTHC